MKFSLNIRFRSALEKARGSLISRPGPDNKDDRLFYTGSGEQRERGISDFDRDPNPPLSLYDSLPLKRNPR